MRRLAALAAAVVVLLALAGTALAAAATHAARVRPEATPDLVTVLAIGSDIGPPHRPGNFRRGRADGIHLIAVDARRKRATIVDIPRDALVGGSKVNAHLAVGGPQRLVAELEAYTGVGVDYWALTSFHGLRSMVADLGGMQVDVDVPMRSTDGRFVFSPGPQHLNGWESLAYLRERKSLADGDFGRTRHHGQFLRFAHRQMREEHGDLRSLLPLVSTFARHTETNIPARRLPELALLALQIRPRDVLQVPLQGSIGVGAGGASIVHLRAGNAFDRIRRGVVGP